ncbi:unnamed protein product [Closterium sp. NIES-65]|nr:unnamed protein product [Closterium sp. NIES-65]
MDMARMDLENIRSRPIGGIGGSGGIMAERQIRSSYNGGRCRRGGGGGYRSLLDRYPRSSTHTLPLSSRHSPLLPPTTLSSPPSSPPPHIPLSSSFLYPSSPLPSRMDFYASLTPLPPLSPFPSPFTLSRPRCAFLLIYPPSPSLLSSSPFSCPLPLDVPSSLSFSLLPLTSSLTRAISRALASPLACTRACRLLFTCTHLLMSLPEQVRILAASAAASNRATLRELSRLTASLKEYASRPLPGCILYVDDRSLNASHIAGPWPISPLSNPSSSASSASSASSSSDGRDPDSGSSYPHNYMEENGENMPYWAASKIINRAYARKHGYRFAVMDPTRYQQDRHSSWFKVLFIQEQLTCCCRWAFCIDSDAYFRFNTHQLSVESWLSQLQIDGYFDWIPKDYGASLVNQTHFPRDPATLLLPDDGDKDAVFALFPRNVDDRYSQYPHARAEALFNPDLEFINAGVSLWRRSAAAIEALRVWYREQEESESLWEHPWEQRRLARLAAFYRKNMLSVLAPLTVTGAGQSGNLISGLALTLS